MGGEEGKEDIFGGQKGRFGCERVGGALTFPPSCIQIYTFSRFALKAETSISLHSLWGSRDRLRRDPARKKIETWVAVVNSCSRAEANWNCGNNLELGWRVSRSEPQTWSISPNA